MADPIGDDDLHAYVDNQPSPERQLDVADYLATRPDVAARVFADIHTRGAPKRVFETAAPEPTPRLIFTRGGLQRADLGRTCVTGAARAAAVVALIAVGWYAHWQAGAFTIPDNDDTPAFVVDAVHAYRTHLARAQARMDDAEEAFSRTQIAMPNLKQDWKLSDAQLYPRTPAPASRQPCRPANSGSFPLFATRTERKHSIEPTVSRSQSETTVYWQRGSTFYAVTGKRPEKVMRSIADTLMKG